MRTRAIAAAALLLLTVTACTGGTDPVATSSAPGSSSAAATSSAPASPSASDTPSETASEEPPLGPTTSVPPAIAAFQLCGTVLGLAAGFIGQVAPEQLAEGRTIAEQARAEYVDDGSGLAQKADAVLEAVEFADQAKVVSSARAFGDACQLVNPGT